MECDKTSWSYAWNSDKNCTQNSASGWCRGGSSLGVVGDQSGGGVGGGGLFDMT